MVGVETGGLRGHGDLLRLRGADGATLEPTELRDAARAASLPRYMLPARWHDARRAAEERNGKIDRPALRERFTPAADDADRQDVDHAHGRQHRSGERPADRPVRDRLGVEVPSSDTDLVADGLIDSLALVTLIVGIEDTFGCR